MNKSRKHLRRGIFLGSTFLLLIVSVVPTQAFCQVLTGTTPIVFPLISPRLTSRFGKRKHPIYRVRRNHTGIDLAAPLGSHIRVVAAGRVIFADTYAGYGKLVTVLHDDGYVSLYGHLSEILTEPGMEVEAGRVIGRLGTSGDSTGPHLHFEWRHDGEILDPLKIFPGLTAPAKG